MGIVQLYFKLLGISLRSRMQFRMDFLTGVFGVILLNVVTLCSIGVILGRFQTLAGWSIWDIVFLYSSWMVSNSLFSLLFIHLQSLEFFIIDGSFDRFLIRPISPLLQLITSEVNYLGLADVIFGVAGLILSMANLHLQLSIWQWLLLLVAILSGAMIECALALLFSSIAFWTGRSAASNDMIFRFANMVQQYPLEMFGQYFQIFVTCFIPVAFINYYPAKFLLGKITAGDPMFFLSFISPLVALILFLVASLVWKNGLHRYTSTGS